MTFGKTIKDLRIKNDMTQEKLAELINISPQAVSCWEINSAMPDISLLPPLANLFNVTTDFLLGMDTYKKTCEKQSLMRRVLNIGNTMIRKRIIKLQ